MQHQACPPPPPPQATGDICSLSGRCCQITLPPHTLNTLPLPPAPSTSQEQLQQQREAASSATSELSELRVVYGKLEATAGKLREAQEGAARELAEQLTKSRETGAALEKQKEKAAHFRSVCVCGGGLCGPVWACVGLCGSVWVWGGKQ